MELARGEQCETGFDEDVGRHEMMRDAVVNFAREAGAFLLVGEHLGLFRVGAKFFVRAVELAADGVAAAKDEEEGGEEIDRGVRREADELLPVPHAAKNEPGPDRQKQAQRALKQSVDFGLGGFLGRHGETLSGGAPGDNRSKVMERKRRGRSAARTGGTSRRRPNLATWSHATHGGMVQGSRRASDRRVFDRSHERGQHLR